MFGGTFDPAYFLTVTAIEQHCLTTTNKRNAALMQSFLSDVLSVPLDRGIVRFNPIPEDCLATGGRTVASNVEKADTDVGVKNPSTYRRKSMRMSMYGGAPSPGVDKGPLKEKRKSILNLGRRQDDYSPLEEKMPDIPPEIKANSKSMRTRSKTQADVSQKADRARTMSMAPDQDPSVMMHQQQQFVQNASPPLAQIGEFSSDDSNRPSHAQGSGMNLQPPKSMPFYPAPDHRKSSIIFSKPKSFANNSRPPTSGGSKHIHSRSQELAEQERNAAYQGMTPPPIPEDDPAEMPRIGKRKSLIALFKRDNNIVKASS